MNETQIETKTAGVFEAVRLLKEDPGLRRRLRKIEPEQTVNALYLEGAQRALARLRGDGFTHGDRALDALLMLAHLDRHEAGRLGRQLHDGGVKPERFRRLADADRAEALEHLRRMIQHCKGAVDAPALARAVYYWGVPVRSPSVRSVKERLANEYYNYTKKEEK